MDAIQRRGMRDVDADIEESFRNKLGEVDMARLVNTVDGW